VPPGQLPLLEPPVEVPFCPFWPLVFVELLPPLSPELPEPLLPLSDVPLEPLPELPPELDCANAPQVRPMVSSPAASSFEIIFILR